MNPNHKDLAELGFYGTQGDIEDVVDPLVTALDGRGDVATWEEYEKAMTAIQAADEDAKRKIGRSENSLKSEQAKETRVRKWS